MRRRSSPSGTLVKPVAAQLWFYPTIGAAIAAGVPWLSFSCPACGSPARF